MAQAVHKKEVKQALGRGDWGMWEEITSECYLKLAEKPEIHRLKSYWKNNIYSAQIIRTEKGCVIGIRRHDQSTEVPWAHKQRIKNELFWKGAQAVEIFPPEDELIDGANMFWLWVLEKPIEGCDLKEALRGIYNQ